jgi:8-oxo-dGTP pyrophosphatase MutT (NUDIX family)
MSIKRWKTLDSRYLIRDRWMTLRADRCETAAGVVLDPYYVQEPEDWVQIVAFDVQDRILLTRQYRHGAGVISLELPCGTVELGETAAQAAARELLERRGARRRPFSRYRSSPPIPLATPIVSTPSSRRAQIRFKNSAWTRRRISSSNSLGSPIYSHSLMRAPFRKLYMWRVFFLLCAAADLMSRAGQGRRVSSCRSTRTQAASP